jgi:hypothetical protein
MAKGERYINDLCITPTRRRQTQARRQANNNIEERAPRKKSGIDSCKAYRESGQREKDRTIEKPKIIIEESFGDSRRLEECRKNFSTEA